MGFKEDAEFARFLTMGAHGTAAIKDDLENQGHRIIELERYAMANKVWAVKVKRLRLPDLLCVLCGRRFESKAKSKLQIKLSHSGAVDREWFAGGMRPDDVFAFIRVVLGPDSPTIGRPLYVTRRALADAIDSVKEGVRKAISQGAEADITWPAWVPSYSGTVVGHDPQSPSAVNVQTASGSLRTYRGGSAWPEVHLYLRPGESFEGESVVVAGAVAPVETRCPGPEWNWAADLTSTNPDDRYPAVKAARFLKADRDLELIQRIAEGEEDWRVRIEALALLASLEAAPWLSKLSAIAVDLSLPVEQQMEAVLVMSEIADPAVPAALGQVARPTEGRHQDVRSAAVWGIGLGAAPDPDHLIPFICDLDDRVALHAAAALPEDLPAFVIDALLGWLLPGADDRQAAVAANLLAQHGCVAELLDVIGSGSGAGPLLAIRALGDLPRARVESRAGRPLDPNVVRVLEPIWIQHRDWLRSPENAGALDMLANQRLRF